MVRWRILRPLAAVVGWGISALLLAAAVLGGLRFLLLTGASPRYLLQRKSWYERAMLGRGMGMRYYVAFGLWGAESGRGRRY